MRPVVVIAILANTVISVVAAIGVNIAVPVRIAGTTVIFPTVCIAVIAVLRHTCQTITPIVLIGVIVRPITPPVAVESLVVARYDAATVIVHVVRDIRVVYINVVCSPVIVARMPIIIATVAIVWSIS